MKKLTIFLCCCLVLTIIYSFTATSIFLFNNKNPVKKECFTQTHWKQMGGFQKYTPDNMRLGCWSTAIAQIVYYNRLKPFGHIAYVSSNGYRINENIDSTTFNWNFFANAIDSTTSAVSIDQMAKYNYDAALVVMKNFGRDSYMHKLAPASLFEAHYPVKASRYISWHNFLPYTHKKLEKIIQTEIDHHRPLMLHFANLKDFGHSVVVDGYDTHDHAFKVHLNQGQGGTGDGWYDFDQGILRPDDGALRVIYTFERL